MSACQNPACLQHLLGTAPHDLPQDIQVHILRKADDVQRCPDVSAHGVHIAERIGGRDLAEQIRILHHRRKKIQCLHDGRVLRDPVNRRVVPAVISDQQVFILRALRETFQYTAKHPGSQLRRTSAPFTKYDLITHFFLFLSPLHIADRSLLHSSLLHSGNIQYKNKSCSSANCR